MSATPILDRQQPPPAPPKTNRWRGLAIGAVVGLAIVLIAGDTLTPLNVLVAMVPALFLGILAHELGHVAAGLIAGFEFRRLLVGPLALTREARGYRLRFIGGRFLAGGYTMMLPPLPNRLRWRWCVFVAGGPIATLLVFGLLAILPWGLFAGALFICNLILAAYSWIPLRNGGHYTDAKIAQILLHEGPVAERLSAVLYLVTLDGQGASPRDWPADVVASLAVTGGDRAFVASARMLLHMLAKDTAPDPEVAAALEQVLAIADQMSGSQRLAYFSEAAFFQGVTNRNAALARDWLADARAVKAAIAQKGWDECALAAIACAGGNDREFEEHRNRALEFLDRQPGPSGSVASSRKRLLELSITAPAPSTHRPNL
jgi:hypothetical protein